MKLDRMTKEEKAKLLGSIGTAVEQVLGGDNLFFMLVVDSAGNMVDVKNVNRAAVPRLLREYADLMER